MRVFGGGNSSYPMRVMWSYLPDWIITIVLWAVFYLLDKIHGYRRLFDVTDTSLAHPFKVHERVPVWLLAVVAGVGPAVIILVVSLIRRSFWDAHNGILGLILALGLGQTFTDILKITAGRPRPDLFDRCQLPESYTANPVHGLTSWRECTRTDLLKDGFRSFPSGHSSFAWTGMWYLTLYLAAKFHIANRRGYTIKSWTLLIPISCASLITISRTMDYRHHATDVIAGSIVGVLSGWWGYRQYYPALHAPASSRPYPPRIPADDALPLHDTHHQGQHNTGERVPLSDAAGDVALTSPSRAAYPMISRHGNGGVGNGVDGSEYGQQTGYDQQASTYPPVHA